jgi:superfamily I DNA and/or RNA helicase
MRPEISTLIRTTLYKRLVDHGDIKSLPDVVGMRKNVFWYDHMNLEDSSRPEENQRSKSSIWEVNMTHALVRHIVRQGTYNSRDIAVLTPYVGQLQKLRAAMRQDFEIVLGERDQDTLVKDGFVDENPSSGLDSNQATGPILQKKAMSELLRIGTVDNFQGEEAKIIIVSLVRSNSEKKVGFLRTTNRINVLLSRAQHGMYLIGNTGTYSNVPMWSQILGMLRADGSVGEAFELCCPRHTETEILVSKPEDFAILSPDGGCRKPCDR